MCGMCFSLKNERREGKHLGRIRVLRGRVIIQRILQIMFQIGLRVAANGFNRIENKGTSRRNGAVVVLVVVAVAGGSGPNAAASSPVSLVFLEYSYSTLMMIVTAGNWY